LCRERSRQEEAATAWKAARGAGECAGHSGNVMSESEARKLYQRALGDAAEIAKKSVSDGFEESRKKTASEFCEFLDEIGHGLAFENATDMDVIAFIQGWWLPAHVVARSRTQMDEEKCDDWAWLSLTGAPVSYS
jgi:hypothetical protein